MPNTQTIQTQPHIVHVHDDSHRAFERDRKRGRWEQERAKADYGRSNISRFYK